MQEAHDGMVWARVMRGTRVSRDQKPSVRFWIITMMLVLIGLSTLKLR